MCSKILKISVFVTNGIKNRDILKFGKGIKKNRFNTVNLRRKPLWLLLSLISVNKSPNTINLCLLKSYSVEVLDNLWIYFG